MRLAKREQWLSKPRHFWVRFMNVEFTLPNGRSVVCWMQTQSHARTIMLHIRIHLELVRANFPPLQVLTGSVT